MTQVHAAFVIALSGGIASGKSEAARAFRELKAPAVDADIVARDLVKPDQPALAEIAAEFGSGVLTPAGELDRHRMRERIFGDAEDRRRLEAIIHPKIRKELLGAATKCREPYCVLVIPLLSEAWADYDWVDRVLIIDVAEEIQLARLMCRDGMTRDAATQIIAAQASRAQRLALADDVIDNSDGVEALRAPVARLHRKYLGLARDRAR